MAKFYIEAHGYWQNSPSLFVGPFDTRDDAEAAVQAAIAANGSCAVRSGQMARDIKNGVRLYVHTTTEARRAGMFDKPADLQAARFNLVPPAWGVPTTDGEKSEMLEAVAVY
jgi:hypothetical protein